MAASNATMKAVAEITGTSACARSCGSSLGATWSETWPRRGRGGPIRTGDLLLPKQVRYQAALRPGWSGRRIAHPTRSRRAGHEPLRDAQVTAALLVPV